MRDLIRFRDGRDVLHEEVHVETHVRTSDLRPVLYCKACGEQKDFPIHCFEPMELTEEGFVCTECGEELEMPTHCGSRMMVTIVG